MVKSDCWPKPAAQGAMGIVVRETGIPDEGDGARWVMLFGVGKLGLPCEDVFVGLDGRGVAPTLLSVNGFNGMQPWQALQKPLWAEKDYELVSLLPPGVTLSNDARYQSVNDLLYAAFRERLVKAAPWTVDRTYYSKEEAQKLHVMADAILVDVVLAQASFMFSAPSLSRSASASP